MANTRLPRSLFIPALYGQHKLWKNLIAREASKADEIIQFGNLITLDLYGNDSVFNSANEQMLDLIHLFRSTQERWLQLMGPNEVAALNNPDEWTSQRARKILRDGWLGEERSFVTAGVNKGRLVTHGGLTYGEWCSLGKPDSADETARLLNSKYNGTLYQGEAYSLGDRPNFSANPIWAHPYRELYPSWITTPEVLPFDQIHGSGSINSFEGRELTNEPGSIMGFVDKLSFRRWGAEVTIREQIILSLDLALPQKLTPSMPGDRQLYIERETKA